MVVQNLGRWIFFFVLADDELVFISSYGNSIWSVFPPAVDIDDMCYRFVP